MTQIQNMLNSFKTVGIGSGFVTLEFDLDDSDRIVISDADDETNFPSDTTKTFVVAVWDEDGNELSMTVCERHDLTHEIEKVFDDYNVFRR